MKKRALSLFMALALCLSMAPEVSFAEEAGAVTEQEAQNGESTTDVSDGDADADVQDAEKDAAVQAAQEQIDALPAVDELDGMDDDDAMAVYEAFQAACDAYYDTLTEEQQAQLKNTEKLAALSDWFNARAAETENNVAVQANTANVAEVTVNGKTTEHTDIVAAFDAAQLAESAAVKLLENVTIPTNADGYSYGIELKSGNITLDLNGCTIQTTGGASGFTLRDAVFYINNGSSLTVQDKNTNGGGKIVQPNGGQAIHVGGALTVESGVTIEVTSNDESSSSNITDKNCAVFLTGGGTANILGGTLTGKQGIYVKKGTLTVSGGTIHGKNSYALQVAQNAVATNDSKVQLSGGSYTTGVENGCSIYNSDGTAAALLDSGYRFESEGRESKYSDDTHGVVGDTTVAKRPANEFAYMDADGTVQTQANCTELTADGFQGALAGEETWFAANTDITADGPLQVRGTVNLILCDGVTVTLNKGIALNGSEDQPGTLNIYAQSGGTGKLICGGASNSIDAGIYISTGMICKTALNIYGGNITATGSLRTGMSADACGAGIGTSANYNYESTMAVNIFGGTVTAKSGGEGAQAIGQGTQAGGTVTVTIAPGMKCVKTDDQSTACGYGNIDGTSVTVTKCNEHEWEYKGENDKHTKTCKLCNADGGSEAHKAEKYVSVSESQHDIYCVCGMKLNTEEHAMQYNPNPDGLTHKKSCKYCGWTSADEKHTFGENGDCVCGIGKSAEYGGQEYASLQAAVNAAAASGGTVTLARDVSENVTVTGGTLTVDLNGKTWNVYENVNSNTIQKIPLTVTDGSVTLKNGTISQELPTDGKCGIQITGGSVTVQGDAVVIGSNKDGAAQLPPAPAIELENGGLTLATGATLVYGLKVPEGKHLSDYLPAGTAFGLRSYDESTTTWTVDKGLLNAYTINNYAEHNMALVVVEHSAHSFTLDSDGKYTCACGYTCTAHHFGDGKCDICGYECTHPSATEADDKYTCDVCKEQMVVKVEKDGKTTYYAERHNSYNDETLWWLFNNNLESGSTVTLLADNLCAWAFVSGGKQITLNLNGKTLDETFQGITVGQGSQEDTSTNNKLTVKGTLGTGETAKDSCYAFCTGEGGELDLKDFESGGKIGGIIAGGGKVTTEASTNDIKIGTLYIIDGSTDISFSTGTFDKISFSGSSGSVKLGDLLADGYAFQNGDGSYVEYGTTLQDASICNVKVVKCLHPSMQPDATTGIATCEYCGKSGKFVASVDGNTYEKWDEAISYWLANGGTLKLYGDYTAANGTWSIGSGSHTINLNGHTMSVQDKGAFKPTNNMHLTITDGTEIGQITNILLDGSQGGSFTLESGYVCNLEMTGGAVVALKGGSVDKLDVQNCSANTNLSIQGGSLGELNIKDWADGMHVSATSGSLGAYNLPSGKILADVLDHQYYAEGTSLDRQVDTTQPGEKFVIEQAPYDFGSTSKAADVPINGSIPFTVDSPSENVGVYEVKWYRRTNSGAEHITENRVAGVEVGDTLDVFCVITGVDRPGGAMQWQVAVKGYTINVVPAKLNGDQTVITQKPGTGNTGNPADNRLVVTPFSSNALSDVEYKFEVTYNGQPLELNRDYTIKDSSNRAKNAGTHTLTIEGTGNYTGEKSVTWTLEPYELSVENFCPAQITKMYDGTDAVTDSTNGISGLDGFNLDSKNLRNPILSTVDVFNLDKSDYELSNMKFDSAEAGDRTFTGTMTLTSGGNFVFAGGSRVMQIEYGSSRVSVSINRATIADPAAKALQVANNHAATYTVDLSALLPALEAPREYGAVTYGAPTVNLSSGYYTDGARVEGGKLILPIQAVKTDTTGSIGSVQVKVSTTNYHDFTLTINVIAKNRITPTGTPTLSKNAITYGDALNTIALSGKLYDNVNNVDVDGTFEWVDGTHIPVVGNGTYAAEWIFEPTDTEKYLTVSGRSNITVEKAQQYGKVSMAGYTYGQAPSTPTLTDRTGDANAQVTYRYSAAGSGSVQTWDIQNPPALNAGTYRMYASIGDTDNYYGFEAVVYCEFVVAKATPTYTAPTGLTAKYGQTLADVTLPDGWSWTDSSESVGGASTAAKTFQATFTPIDTDNYNMVENIELEVMVNKADGGSLKTVELAQKYTDTSEHTYTPDWSGLPGGQTWRYNSEYSVSTGSNVTLTKQDFAADGSLLTYALSGGKAGEKIALTLKASCDNYGDFTITLNIPLTEKDDQKPLTITGADGVVYGQTLTLTTTGGSGTGKVTYSIEAGSEGEATIDADGVLTPVKAGYIVVRATKAADAEYNEITSDRFEILITQAPTTGEPRYTKITTGGKTLADAKLTVGTLKPAEGKLEWIDFEGDTLPNDTEVEVNAIYTWCFTPTDTNYDHLTGDVVLYHVEAPAISAQPKDASVKAGERAVFEVTATGTDLTYQWQIDRNDGRGFVNLKDATGASYTSGVTDTDCNGFKYQCVISNAAGSVTTETAILTVTVYYTITATAGEHGSISPSGAVEAAEGSSQTFVITADAGYEIESLKVDGGAVEAAASYTFTDVRAAHTIEVTFKHAPYRIIDGADSSWTQNVDGSLVIRGNGEFSEFQKVLVDGIEIAPENYTAAEGSTIITLKPEFLSTLSEGSHTFEIIWRNGSADTQFAVARNTSGNNNNNNNSNDNAGSGENTADTTVIAPKTGDASRDALLVVLAVVSFAGLAGMLVLKKRNAYK